MANVFLLNIHGLASYVALTVSEYVYLWPLERVMHSFIETECFTLRTHFIQFPVKALFLTIPCGIQYFEK